MYPLFYKRKSAAVYICATILHVDDILEIFEFIVASPWLAVVIAAAAVLLLVVILLVESYKRRNRRRHGRKA